MPYTADIPAGWTCKVHPLGAGVFRVTLADPFGRAAESNGADIASVVADLKRWFAALQS